MKKNNYFTSILQEINKKILSKEYQAAYDLLDQELRAPYIPSNFENQFLQLKAQLLPEVVSSNSFKTTNTISPDQIISYLIASPDQNPHNMEWVVMLEHVNLRDYLAEIAIFLKNSANDPFAKTFILEIAKKQEINQQFSLTKFQVVYQVNPLSMKSLAQYLEINQVINFLTKNLEFNPNLLTVCIEIWKWYTYLIFPKLPRDFQNFKAWASTIIYYVLKLQKQEINLADFALKYHVLPEEITKLIRELEILKEV